MARLFDQATALTTLARAFDRVEDNGGSPGLDGVSGEEFAADLEARLLDLHHDLRDGRYRPQPLLRFAVKKKAGGERGLSIPAIRDRVAQTAAAIVLGPVLDAEFEDASFGYRAGRSVTRAVERIMWLRDRGYHWVVDADIRSCFDEIPHDRLLAVLERTIDDPPLVSLVQGWIQAEVAFNGRRTRLARGVPQGCPISPLLANLYLDAFDEACDRRGLKLVRYADDFVLLCRNRAAAERALEITEAALGDLRLVLNADKTRVTSFEAGFRYLGVQFVRSLAFRPRFPEDTGLSAPPSEAATTAAASPPTAAAPSTVPVEPGRTCAEPPTGTPAETRREPMPAAAEGPPTAIAVAMREALASRLAVTTPGDDEPPPADHDPVLRTLFAVTPGLILAKKDERFVVRQGDRHVLDVPSLQVDQVAVFGPVQVTTAAIHFCARHDIPVYFLSRSGRFVAAVHGAEGRAVGLQARQFERRADPAFRLGVARAIVRAKIANTRTLLLRWERNGVASAGRAASRLDQHARATAVAATLDELRGLEGISAADYFAVWPDLATAPFEWHGRRKHPAPDPLNALLSFGYSLLYANAQSFARMAGLHPYAGFLHEIKDGHAGVASDLIEEFRAAVVDRAVLALVRRRQVEPADFVTVEGEAPGCWLTDAARRRVVRAFEQALNRPVRHPDAGVRCDYRRAIGLQARRLAQAVAEDRVYVPFATK
jgi:CRISPR-associated protein Cas1